MAQICLLVTTTISPSIMNKTSNPKQTKRQLKLHDWHYYFQGSALTFIGKTKYLETATKIKSILSVLNAFTKLQGVVNKTRNRTN